MTLAEPLRVGGASVLCAAFVAAGLAAPATPAQAAPPQAVAEAQRLRDSGNLDGAVAILRTQIARQPDDGDAARLLAQTLYWQKDIEGARRIYEDALLRHPGDTTLRLQYGRMLAETRQWTQAEALLTPLREGAATRAEANTLLGTIAYWRGDLTRAARLFRDAIAVDANQPDARRQLSEIVAATAPWIRLASSVRHDDQPLDRLALGVESGWFATPLIPVTVRVEPMAFRVPDRGVRTLWSGELGVTAYIPPARLETEVAGGVLHRGSGPSAPDDSAGATDWRGRAALGIRLAPGLTIRGRAERVPYLHTTSSIATPIMTDAASGVVRLDTRGWLGEAAVQAERFPDGNRVSSAYGWLLAPLVHRDRATLQAGYAFGRANADESRFVLVASNQPYAPSDPRFNTAGRYVPYYTPMHLLTHSVAAAAALRPVRSAIVRLSGSYALRASDEAPQFSTAGGQLQRLAVPRTFSPWRAESTVDLTLRDGLTLGLGGEMGRTAFYTWATADIRVTYRFVRADGPHPARE